MSTSTLKVQHSSLQFSDTSAQQKADISDLFEKGVDFPIKTGTEAGPEPGNDNRKWLIKYAKQYKHNIHFSRSNWIAVDRAIVKKGSFERGMRFLVDNDQTWGKGHDTVLAYVGFQHVDPGMGQVWQGCVHFPLRGDDPGEPNFRINKRVALGCSRWMAWAGQGWDIAFLNGDFNTNDIRNNFDQNVGNFTSMADELDRHPNTGHGPIDGLCSYDRDKRVSAKWYQVLDDKEFFQHSDHFVLRGAWTVKHLRG